jgi:subtilisin family serine protease
MKTGLFRSTLLACAIGCFLAPLATLAYDVSSLRLQPPPSQEPELIGHILVFEEPGLMYYEGGVKDLRATAISATGQRKVDVSAQPSVAYLNYLDELLDERASMVASRLGRSIGAVYRYDTTITGLGVRLTHAEAASLRSMPGLKAIHESGVYQLDTNRGPEFIGAGQIWDGTSVPGNVGTRGQGVVIGIIDSGANRAHPSFGLLPAECGADAGQPKLTAYTCLTGGVCTTTDVPGATCANNNEGTAEDCNGHGSHTASTAAGNTLLTTAPAPAPARNISGVATCAKINSYKVCATSNCDGIAIVAAIERAIVDGVDVINYSISGGGGNDASVWLPGATADRFYLDALNAGILVAASAGNTRADNPTPEGDVNHRGPWLTSVAASSHDEVAIVPGSLQVTGPGAVPGNLAGSIALTASSSPVSIAQGSNLLIRDFPTAPTGCNADPAYPANYFAGGTALVSRGVCSFAEKLANVVAAGASALLVYNNAAGGISMAGLDAATIPAYSLLQSDGQALVGFSATLGGAPIEADAEPPLSQGDVLANFSLRGPISPVAQGAQGSNNSFDITKPDITAPGIDIYAAVNTPGNYGILSGTSMSSPHIAGAFALLRAAQPTWSATEIKSALMMTASNAGTQEDAFTPWRVDDIGSGRADLTRAALAGLVMDESVANFLAADPNAAGDPRTLNLPSMRHTACSPDCTWTRTVKSTLTDSATWNVAIEQPDGFDVEVTPAQFTLASGASQTLTIAATPLDDPGIELRFGRINLSTTTPGQSPDLALTVAVLGTAGEPNDVIFADGFECAPGFPGCEVQPPQCVPEQLLADTGFEATDPVTFDNPVWESTSSTFGSALCNEAFCGLGGGAAGPRTGGFWAWLGGTASQEIGTVTQAVTIPAGADRFVNYWLRIGAVGAGAEMTVSVDGTILETVVEPGVAENVYAQRSVDVSAFADGGSHTLTFEYSSPGGDSSNFNLDDVTLECSPAP